MKPVSQYMTSNSDSRNNLLRDPLVTNSGEQINDDGSFDYVQKRSELRKKLQYFFMNPIDKWKTKGRFPSKLILQIIKIIFVTLHICSIGKDKYQLLSHQRNMVITFRELFLINWDASREVTQYPPPTGAYAVYTRDDFYATIDYAIKAYSSLTLTSLGSFGYIEKPNKVSPIILTFNEFQSGQDFPFNFTYNYNYEKITRKYVVDVDHPPGHSYWNNFSIENLLKNNNSDVNFDTLLSLTLEFNVRTIYLSAVQLKSQPLCFEIRINIFFDNNLHDGQIPISLTGKSDMHECHGNIKDSTFTSFSMKLMLTIIVILLCFFSLTLCIRSAIKGVLLKNETCAFFAEHFAHKISFSDQIEFIDFWIIMILCNDILLIFGSIFKFVEYQNNTTLISVDWSVLFGFNILLVYAGLLRYLSFFPKYNILILAVKRAIPDILRFTLCAAILYG